MISPYKKIHLVAAARPNFMKIGPLYHALSKKEWADTKIIHTGQHYDLNMSDVFFKELMLPAPHIHLGIGSGTHAEQTGRVMIAYEKILKEENPDLVVVVGDVNSTMAATLAAKKLHLEVGHLESGLRSYDREMPEEINRVVTDALADILWTPSYDADENLRKEGIPEKRIERVGNIMIDALEMLRKKIEELHDYEKYGSEKRKYGVVTLHRPSNVDDFDNLKTICDALIKVSEKIGIIFPVHPRTKKELNSKRLYSKLRAKENIFLIEPCSYIQFMNLIFNCRFVITDSGGVQEETTYLGIPCLTLRKNTERPITIEMGTNRLCELDDIVNNIEKALDKKPGNEKIEMWDGHTAKRVVHSIEKKIFRC